MWRPDFAFMERIEARLVGAHRALCVYSFVHRGTPERPGLVLGLDHGGTCRGLAYRVSVKKRAEVIAYLRKREQVTSVYREVIRPIWLRSEPAQRVPGLCYVVIADTRNTPEGSRWSGNCITYGKAMANRVPTATMSLRQSPLWSSSDIERRSCTGSRSCLELRDRV